MTTPIYGEHGQNVRISYQLIRNVTAPEEKSNGVQTYVANVPAKELLKLGTEENLRSYIAEHNNKKRNAVHKAIEGTIDREPDRFINRNSGITIAASRIEVNDKEAFAELRNASIINGAQTQGEIRRYLNSFDEDSDSKPIDFHVRVEINVDPVASSVTETAIARNSATGVQSISQAGKRGHFEDLAKAVRKEFGQDIRKSETDQDVIETFQLLQFTRLLMPASLLSSASPSEMLKPYKNKAKCLEEFSDWYLESQNGKDTDGKARYDFVIQMAGQSLREYQYWEQHPGWNGKQIWEETKKGGRAVRRDKNGKVVWVSPGLIFPIMNAISAFVVQDEEGKWKIDKPKLFKPDEMIRKAVAQFRALESNPMDMGRSESAYEALLTYPQTIAEVMRDFREA
jgi:AIPR protein